MNENEFRQIFPLGNKNEAFAQYFIGQSYLQMLTTERVGIANVTFEPGCRKRLLSGMGKACTGDEARRCYKHSS